MKKFYVISILFVISVLSYINYEGDLEPLDLDILGRKPQSIRPIVPDKKPIKRAEIKILTEKDVANVKLINVQKIPPKNQLLIKAIKRGSSTVIRSKKRQDEVFVLKEMNALSPSFQTTLGTNIKNKQESNQRLFTGSSATKFSEPASKMAMAFYNSSVSGIISRPDGSTTYIQSDSKTGKVYSYTAQASEADCHESVDSEGEVVYNFSASGDDLINIKTKGEEVEIFPAENTNTGGTSTDEEEAGIATGINPPEYDKSLVNINWLIWVDKASTNLKDSAGNLILTLEEHASLQLSKVAMMNALYQNQLGIKFTLQEIILMPEDDLQNDPIYNHTDETNTAPDMTQPQYCLQEGARCNPILGAKHLMEKYRPREIYHWDQVPYQMRANKTEDTYKWAGLAGCCAGAASGVYVQNFSTKTGALTHETGHNIGISHTMSGGIMGGSAVDGRSFFSFVREGDFKGIKLGSTQAYEKMSGKPWFTSAHPKYAQMRNPEEMPWAVADNYQLIVESDPNSREITISPMTNDLLFTPEGKWNESLDIPEIGPIYPPNAGVLTLLPDNQVKFVANEGFYGPVKFRYTLRGHLPAYLHASTDPKCLHANKRWSSTYSDIVIEDCNIETEKPEEKDYNFNIPFFPSESPIFKIKNNSGCLRPYSGGEDISTYGLKQFADVYFVGACNGEENWDQWKFEPVAMDIPDVFRIKNKFTGFCLNSMKNMQSDCNDINNYWQVKATPDPSPQEKCFTGSDRFITTTGVYLKNCGDLITDENQDWMISDFPAQSEIRKSNWTAYRLIINSNDNTVSQEGLNIHLRWDPKPENGHYGYRWNFQQVEDSDKYRIINDFSGLCLSRTQTQINCSYKNTTWKITSLGNDKYQITSVPDGDYDTTYQLVSVRQPREGWLHAGDVTIDVVEGTDAPGENIDLAQNLQVTIPMNSFHFWGQDADIEEFIFNPLMDLTLMPQTLGADGEPISIYRNPIQMDLTLGTSEQYQTIKRNAISIESVVNTTPALADYRIITGQFTQGGLSGELANGYIAVKLRRDAGTYRPDYVTFDVEVKDQKGIQNTVRVNLIPPIARVDLDSVEVRANEAFNLGTQDIASAPSIVWRKIYGPGNFVESGSTAYLTEPGKYLLRMTAIKNGYSTFQEVNINVLTDTGEEYVPEGPLAPGEEAPPTNKIVIRPDGTRLIITPDGVVSEQDPETGDVITSDKEYKQLSIANPSNFSYINNDDFLFVTLGGNEINTGVKGKHVSMGVDGFILAILDDQECLNRGKSPGCLYQYPFDSKDENYWGGKQRFTGKNSQHQTLSEIRDVFARDIHVLSVDHIAIVDVDGALFEMSEHISTKEGEESRGNEFWEVGGVWRKVKISIHGRIVGIGEDNILKKWYKGSWFPMKQNVGDFSFEHNGKITAIDFDNNIEDIPEPYFSSHFKVNHNYNAEVGEISLGQDGLGHFRRFWSNTAKSIYWFGTDINKKNPINSNISGSLDYANVYVANASKVCSWIQNSAGFRIFKENEDVAAPPTQASFQDNIVCASDGTVMSIITNDNAANAGIPEGSALQLINGSWYPVGGKLKQLDIASEHMVYGVGLENRVWKKEGKNWRRIAGLMKQIAVGADGTLAGIGTDDFVYLRIEEEWVNLDVKAKKIAASVNNQIVYIGMDDIAYTNYTYFFPIPIIHNMTKSVVRPRKGVAYQKIRDYRPIFSFPNGTSIWEATNLPDNYVNLGHVVSDSTDEPSFETRGYLERVEAAPDMMVMPTDYEELAVLHVGRNLKVYRPIAQAGYSCLGHVAWGPEDPTSDEKPPLELIRCVSSDYIENALLEPKADSSIFRIIPANDRASSTEYFQFWTGEESTAVQSTFYIPMPKKEFTFSLFSSAHAAEATSTEDPVEEVAPVGAVLLGEEFLTTEAELPALDDELELLADEELEEAELDPPTAPPTDPSTAPTTPEGAVGIPTAGTAGLGSRYESSCGSSGDSSSLMFFSNFLLGLLLTFFRRKK
ncbi:MAG: hypothetical protein DRQ89_08915 [Epsilonproteobacteria bacterium]|nr:MAG: hypothetical protein DRQ89_08915 [Campylobacterota bacterium]